MTLAYCAYQYSRDGTTVIAISLSSSKADHCTPESAKRPRHDVPVLLPDAMAHCPDSRKEDRALVSCEMILKSAHDSVLACRINTLVGG